MVSLLMPQPAVFLGFVLAMLLAAGVPAIGASVSLVPSQDNTLIQYTEGVSTGVLSNGTGDIFVGRTNQDGQESPQVSIRRGLIQFDIASVIPSGRVINSVSLTMRDVMGRNGDPEVRLHRVTSTAPWGEGASYFPGGQGVAATDGDATWLHTSYDADNPQASPTWDTPGGDFVETASASAIVFDDEGGGQLFTWTGAGMVADVQGWLTDPSSNRGWIMIGDEAHGQTAKRFDSGDLEREPDNYQPSLTIEFGLPGDYNDDGAVDAADYVVWSKFLGTQTPLRNETATPGEVTFDDYDVWLKNFSSSAAGTGSAGNVPEPASGGFAFMAIVVHLLSDRRVKK